MKRPELHFIPPSLMARAVNRLYGSLASLGLGPSDSFLLLTQGRKTGRMQSTPVNVLRYRDKLYLIGTRGHTQWSRNAQAAGKVTLKRGRISLGFCLRAVTDEEKPEILKAYLSRFSWMVRRFFPIAAVSPAAAFAAIAARYPVFELLPENPDPQQTIR
jgi:deazaflavin-dependent oxidoreductase (nitroreductase family)